MTVKLLQNGDWPELLDYFKEAELQSLYVEGGPAVLTELFQAVPVNQLITYLDPQIIGDQGLAGAQFPAGTAFTHRTVTQLGDDIRIDERNDE